MHETLIDSAAQLFQEKKFAEALAAYTSLRDRLPEDARFADRLGHCLVALEDWPAALQAWLRAISCHGLTAVRLNFVVLCLIELRDYATARTLLQQHRAALPLQPRFFVLSILAALGAGDTAQAVQLVSEMAALPADDAIAAFDELLRRLDRLGRAGHAARIADWLAQVLPALAQAQPFLRIGIGLATTQARWDKQRGAPPNANAPDFASQTAQDTIAAAQALARQNGPEAGFALLVGARGAQKIVTPHYDGTIGRMALRAGKLPEALAYFERARLAFRTPPPWVFRGIGEALLAIDRAAGAGRHFHLARQAGADILDIKEQIAMQDFPAPPLPPTAVDYRHVYALSLLDTARNVSYLSIPKNACSILKAIFVMNSPFREAYLASGLTIHEYYPAAANSIDAATAIAANPARIVVLRDPLNRLVSCYLNKFARPVEQNPGMQNTILSTIAKVQARLGLAADMSRSISFAEFVAYVANAPDAACDLHWIPQHRLCGDDVSIYAHVGRFERLDATFDVLQSRYGMVLETSVDAHIKFPETHATRHDPDAADRQAWRMLPDELRAMPNGFPPSVAFYDDDLRETVLQRYAVDARLHAAV